MMKKHSSQRLNRDNNASFQTKRLDLKKIFTLQYKVYLDNELQKILLVIFYHQKKKFLMKRKGGKTIIYV